MSTPTYDPLQLGAVPMGEPTPQVDAQLIQTASQVAQTPTENRGEQDFVQPGPSASDLAAAAWRRENTIGSLTGYGLIVGEDGDLSHSGAAEFNPQGYFAQSGPENEDLRKYVMSGYFDSVRTEGEYEQLATRVRQELKDTETLSQGGWTGMGMTALVTLADVTMLLPFANAKKGAGIAYQAGRFAAMGAAQQGVQEAALHATQDTRTLQESLLNVGMSTAFSGGLGVFAGALAKRGRSFAMDELDLNRPTRHMVGEPGGDMTLAHEIGPVNTAGPQGSVGAARAGDSSELLGPSVPDIVKPVTIVTPVGRAFHYGIAEAREALQGMLDLGGGLTKGMARGEAHGITMVDVKRGILVEQAIEASNIDSFHAKANADVGGTTTGIVRGARDTVESVTGKGGNKISRRLFHSLVYRKLTDDFHQATGTTKTDGIDGVWFREQMRKQGHGDEAIKIAEKHADDAAEIIHKNNAELEKRMVDNGMITKEDALGRGYGTAQLWKRRAISSNPARFREMMLEYLIDNPDEEWLKATFKIDQKQFRELPRSSGKRSEIINAYAGDEKWLNIDRSTARVQSAMEQMKLHQQALEAIADSKNAIEIDVKRAGIKRTKAKARAATAKVAHEQLEIALTSAELQMRKALSKISEDAAVNPATVTGRTPGLLEKLGKTFETMDVQSRRVGFETDDITRILEGNKTASRDEWANAVHDHARNSPEVKAARAARDEAIRAFKATHHQLEAAGRAAGRVEGDVAKAMKRAEEIAADITKSGDAAIARAQAAAKHRVQSGQAIEAELADKLSKSRQRLGKLQKAESDMELAYQQSRAAMRDVNMAYREVGQDVRSYRRLHKKASRQLARDSGRKTYYEVADEIVDHMTGHTMAPAALDRAGFLSNRAKDRKFVMTTDMRRRFESEGFLNDDLGFTRSRVYDDTSGHIAIHEVLKGADNAEMSGTIAKGKAAYNARIGNARENARILSEQLATATDPATIKSLKSQIAASTAESIKLDAEQIKWVRDIEFARDRILGRPAAHVDPNSLWHWMARKVHQLTYLRFSDMFLISSIPDIAGAVLYAAKILPKAGTAPFKHMVKIHKALKQAAVVGDRVELSRLLASFENTAALERAGRMNSKMDGLDDMGIGAIGGPMHWTTSKIDAVGGYLQDRASLWNGMSLWNTALKTSAGITQWGNLSKQVGRYAEIEALAGAGKTSAKKEMALLASIGIGRREARMIDAMLKKHGSFSQEYGLIDPNFARWAAEGPDGSEAAQISITAVRRAQDRLVLTPNVGDTPILMSGPTGSILLMLQSFGFASVNRFMRPVSQRIMHYRDAQSMMAVGVQFSLAAAAYTLRGALLGRETADIEEDPAQWAYEVMMRTSFLGHFSPYMDVAFRFAGNHVNEAVGHKIIPGTGSRFAERSWMEGLGGASFSTLKEIQSGASNVRDGNAEKLKEQALRMAPYGDYFRMFNLAADRVQK